MSDYTVEINGNMLEYIDDDHVYLVDGIIVPSITQILSSLFFPDKYEGVNRRTLANASVLGTEVHEAIEKYCTEGRESDLSEVRGFKFLRKHYGFEVIANEVPVILYQEREPVRAGRLDLVIKEGEQLGLADIKRTATLDREYLTWQLNLYRQAYEQSYHRNIDFLRGIRLRKNVRQYVEIEIMKEGIRI